MSSLPSLIELLKFLMPAPIPLPSSAKRLHQDQDDNCQDDEHFRQSEGTNQAKHGGSLQLRWFRNRGPIVAPRPGIHAVKPCVTKRRQIPMAPALHLSRLNPSVRMTTEMPG